MAEENGLIAGAVMCGHDGRRGCIFHTAVLNGFQGKGIGKALVEAALSALKKEKITKISLVVFSKNTSGSGFWQKQGFSVRRDLDYMNKGLVELERIDT